MSFWKPIFVLIHLRRQAASNDFAEQPGAFLGRVIMGLLLALAAFSLSNSLGSRWDTLTPVSAGSQLNRLLLMTQIFWALALLLPGVVTLQGRTPPQAVLRAFPLRPLQSFLANMLASLLDAPTVIAALALMPLLGHLLLRGQWEQAIIALFAFCLLGLQVCALVQIMVDAGALAIGRLRRWAEIPAITALLLLCLCAGVPPAFASLTTAPRQNPDAIHIQWPSLPTIDPTPALPSGLACHAILAVRQADAPGAAVSLLELIVFTGITLMAARAASYASSQMPYTSPPVRPSRYRRSLEGQLANDAGATALTPSYPDGRYTARDEPAGAMCRLAALLVTEWRLLLRKPENYLPLRQPAGILLLGVMAFLAPDMGRDPVYNLKELLGLGAVLYNVLWQMQLFCNRFGSESGTAALLFSLSIPRGLLLLGKNLTLFLLLLLLDSAGSAGLCVVAEAPRNIPLFLLWLPMVLITLTALGNLVSVIQPFSIARHDLQNRGDAPDGLAFVYICVGTVVWPLLLPAIALAGRGGVGIAGAFMYVLLLYFASLAVATVLLKRQERRMIARLDRNGE